MRRTLGIWDSGLGIRWLRRAAIWELGFGIRAIRRWDRGRLLPLGVALTDDHTFANARFDPIAIGLRGRSRTRSARKNLKRREGRHGKIQTSDKMGRKSSAKSQVRQTSASAPPPDGSKRRLPPLLIVAAIALVAALAAAGYVRSGGSAAVQPDKVDAAAQQAPVEPPAAARLGPHP